ncbi:MAG: hypothetical protein JO089_08665 [Alphaproteobacteria bacterium]|nr:hypothetical protein [Alphaproteobacteria bacterium]
MTEPVSPAPPQAHSKGFNYCFWGKLLVAIPALPIIAVLGASFFNGPLLQFIGGGAAVGFAVWAALKIDRLPFLQRKLGEK